MAKDPPAMAAEKTAAPNPARPLPVPDAASREFFDGAARGQLMIQKCARCGSCRIMGEGPCNDCRSPGLEWLRASGRATLVTHARMHQRYHPAFYDEVPYLLVVVELAEGPRMITRLVEAENTVPKAGMALTVVFEEAGEGIFLPKFRPA